MIALLLVVGLSIVFYAGILARLLQLNWGRHPLQPAPDARHADCVTVLIAARDEAAALVPCLRSVLEQKCVGRVVFVDDHSTDGTLSLARGLAAGEPRLLVLSAPELEPGWIGKSYALHYGMPQVNSTYVLFADADVLMRPGTVATAVRLMEEEGLDHLSGYFRLRCGSVAESICAPVLAVGAAITHLAEARTSACGIGAFNMLRTDFYRQMGGHEAIKGAIVDDVALAQHAKEHGAKTKFVDLSDCIEVRLFEGMGGFVRKVRRATVPYLDARRDLPLAGGTIMMVLGLATAVAPLVGVALLCAGAYTVYAEVLLGLWAVAYGLGLASVRHVREYHTGPGAWGLLYPIAVVLFGWAVASGAAALLLGRDLGWRGRSYPLRGQGR